MDRKQDKTSSTPTPFLAKTYEMVDDHSTDRVVSWSSGGLSFIVWNSSGFSHELLPLYFKHNNFSSFVRQLNTYGFRKIDPVKWEFANPGFIKGQKHLMDSIHRKKPVHTHSSQVNSSSLNDKESYVLKKEIQRLEHEKNVLQMKLEAYESEKKEFWLSSSLGNRVRGLEYRQEQLLSFIDNLVQQPGFACSFEHQLVSSNSNKKRRLPLKQKTEHIENNCGLVSIPKYNEMEKLEKSLAFWEDFVQEIESLHQESCELGSLPEKNNFSGATSVSSAKIESPPFRATEISYPPELAGCFNGTVGHYTHPLGEEEFSSRSAVEGNIISNTKRESEVDDVNDHFWQHFLTDSPYGGVLKACM